MSLNESPQSVRRRRAPLLVAAVTGAATLAVAASGYAWAETGDTASGPAAIDWQVTPTPTLDANYSLRAVAAASDTDVWAVGYTLEQSWNGTVAAHWDGKEWKQTPTPKGKALTSVSAASGHVWAAGVGEDGSLTARWTGDAWEQVDSPAPEVPAGQTPALTDIDVTDGGTAWAVGCAATEDHGSETPFAQVWEDSAWRLTEVPLPEGATTGCLNSVEVRSADEVWAVGRVADGDSGAPFILRFDGEKWNQVEAPKLDKPDAELTGVLSPAVGRDGGGLYAAGFTSDGFGDPVSGRPLLLEWDGSAWKQVETPDDHGYIYGLGSGPEGGILLSGYGSGGESVLLNYDGETVTPENPPVEGSTAVMGVAMAADTGTVWAVGEVGEPDEDMTGLAAHSA